MWKHKCLNVISTHGKRDICFLVLEILETKHIELISYDNNQLKLLICSCDPVFSEQIRTESE